MLSGIFIVSCKSSDKENQDENAPDIESDAAIRDMLSQDSIRNAQMQRKDTGFSKEMQQAIKDDKTTINVYDIDNSDASYSTFVKLLYKTKDNEKLAVVYGMKLGGKMGTAIVQNEGGKPVKLPQTKFVENGRNFVFSDGTNTLETKDNVILVTLNGKKTSYTRID
jgi:hypothetical protein